jgi:hypothetical protein
MRPTQEVAVPDRQVASAVVLHLEPRTAQMPFGVEAWAVTAAGQTIRLGAVAPYPRGEPGDFLLAWPKALSPAPPQTKLRLTLLPAADAGRVETYVTVGWRR